MANESLPTTTTASAAGTTTTHQEKRNRSIFDVPGNFFDSCRLLSPTASKLADPLPVSVNPPTEQPLHEADDEEEDNSKDDVALPRLTCNTCKAEFESLQDQRSHFKLDIHRFNVKLSIAGKNIVKEDDFDELTSDSFKDFDVSSISGSEDEVETGSLSRIDARKGSIENVKNKLFVRLQTGERISIWKGLLMNESENVSYENDESVSFDDSGYLRVNQVFERLKSLINETRDKTHLRILLLASGGHFAGCVFDGNLVVAHKTFHRYVVRAKAGKKQSSKDGGGRSVHSAGASLRRHNELALKKEIQELLSSWDPYFSASSCVFVYAPSSNRQLLFNGEQPYFNNKCCAIRHVPLTVRRPTLKEVRRLYNQLTQVAYEVDEKDTLPSFNEDIVSSTTAIVNVNIKSSKEELGDNLCRNGSLNDKKSDEPPMSSGSEETKVIGISTPLHEASQSSNANRVLELLEAGLDPCVKDERGRTPYMVASEKEVRNTFRRFMASNPDKWDWHAANVPSALTKEMEESQAAKQAEKDAKRKERAKELKKLRKAKEKKAQAEAAAAAAATAAASSVGKSKSSGGPKMSKEEEMKRAQAAEREKRAAAAERRMATTTTITGNAHGSGSTVAATTSQTGLAGGNDISCSCCNASLAGKVPFHRYNYKYCSTSCMHVHREALEDGL